MTQIGKIARLPHSLRDDHEAARLRMDLERYAINLRDTLRNHNLTSIPVRNDTAQFD
jgi:hypothetical protein